MKYLARPYVKMNWRRSFPDSPTMKGVSFSDYGRLAGVEFNAGGTHSLQGSTCGTSAGMTCTFSNRVHDGRVRIRRRIN
jgi:hypothetical protein